MYDFIYSSYLSLRALASTARAVACVEGSKIPCDWLYITCKSAQNPCPHTHRHTHLRPHTPTHTHSQTNIETFWKIHHDISVTSPSIDTLPFAHRRLLFRHQNINTHSYAPHPHPRLHTPSHTHMHFHPLPAHTLSPAHGQFSASRPNTHTCVYVCVCSGKLDAPKGPPFGSDALPGGFLLASGLSSQFWPSSLQPARLSAASFLFSFFRPI